MKRPAVADAARAPWLSVFRDLPVLPFPKLSRDTVNIVLMAEALNLRESMWWGCEARLRCSDCKSGLRRLTPILQFIELRNHLFSSWRRS